MQSTFCCQEKLFKIIKCYETPSVIKVYPDAFVAAATVDAVEIMECIYSWAESSIQKELEHRAKEAFLKACDYGSKLVVPYLLEKILDRNPDKTDIVIAGFTRALKAGKVYVAGYLYSTFPKLKLFLKDEIEQKNNIWILQHYPLHYIGTDATSGLHLDELLTPERKKIIASRDNYQAIDLAVEQDDFAELRRLLSWLNQKQIEDMLYRKGADLLSTLYFKLFEVYCSLPDRKNYFFDYIKIMEIISDYLTQFEYIANLLPRLKMMLISNSDVFKKAAQNHDDFFLEKLVTILGETNAAVILAADNFKIWHLAIQPYRQSFSFKRYYDCALRNSLITRLMNLAIKGDKLAEMYSSRDREYNTERNINQTFQRALQIERLDLVLSMEQQFGEDFITRQASLNRDVIKGIIEYACCGCDSSQALFYYLNNFATIFNIFNKLQHSCDLYYEVRAKLSVLITLGIEAKLKDFNLPDSQKKSFSNKELAWYFALLVRSIERWDNHIVATLINASALNCIIQKNSSHLTKTIIENQNAKAATLMLHLKGVVLQETEKQKLSDLAKPGPVRPFFLKKSGHALTTFAATPSLTVKDIDQKASVDAPQLSDELKQEIASFLPTEVIMMLAISSKYGLYLLRSLAITRKFLDHVVRGNHTKVELMLHNFPDLLLLLKKGMVTDLSKRTFPNISGFEYALWALDYHMLTLMLSCDGITRILPQLLKQHNAVTISGVTYYYKIYTVSENKFFDFNDTILAALKTEDAEGVHEALRQLPVHVVHEYLSSTPFHPRPEFKLKPPALFFFKDSKTGKIHNWFVYNERIEFSALNPEPLSKGQHTGIQMGSAYLKDNSRDDFNALQFFFRQRLTDRENLAVEIKQQLEQHNSIYQIL